MKKKQGFTLLELIIVVGIIGVLAAVSLVKFAQLIDKAREAATKANLAALRSSIAIYYADTLGIWPRSLDTNPSEIADEKFPAFLPKYIRQIPRATLSRTNPHNNSNQVKIVSTPSYSKITSDQISDLGGWVYSSGSGDIRVNCSHQDTEATSNYNSTICYSNYGHEI